MNNYQYLNWDSKFFGYKVAKLLPENIPDDKLSDILSSLKKKGYRLVYSFVDPQDETINLSHLNNNGILIDEKITFSQRLTESVTAESDDPNIIEYHEIAPEKSLLSIALQCGEFSRFQIDKNFTTKEFMDLYTLWLENSINKKIANNVFAYKEYGKFLGLATVAKDREVGEIGLIGVNSHERGKRIGSKLLKHIFKQYFRLGCKRIDVVTQKNNQLACNFYIKNGFITSGIKNVFHFWLKEET